jgi:hypothetical protein
LVSSPVSDLRDTQVMKRDSVCKLLSSKNLKKVSTFSKLIMFHSRKRISESLMTRDSFPSKEELSSGLTENGAQFVKEKSQPVQLD